MTRGRHQHIIADYRQQLARREKQAEQQLETAYQHVLRTINPALDKLYNQMVEALANGQKIPAHWLYEANRLESIKKLIQNEIDHFGQLSQMQVGQIQHWAAALGQKSAMEMLQATVPEGVHWAFGRPSPEAIANIVGATQRGSPLADLFDGFGREAAQKAGEALITGVALGKNPREIAPLVAQALGISRARALTIARTEGLRAYRSSSLETMRANSDVVDGWIWSAALGIACAACTAMNGTKHTLDETLDAHPNCFPAGTLVSGPRVVGSTTRWYEGEMVEIETVGGNFLSVTPNHPILTPDGWFAAGELREGGHVISSKLAQRPPSTINPDDYQVEAMIEEVAVSLGGALSMVAKAMPTTAEDFHGDGIGSQIHIVRTYRHLWNRIDTTLLQPFTKQQFRWRCVQLLILARLCPTFFAFDRVFSAGSGNVGSLRVLESLFGRSVLSQNPISFSLATQSNIGLIQSSAYDTAINIKRFSDGVLGLASLIAGHNFFDRQFVSSGTILADMLTTQQLTSGISTQQSTFGQNSFQSHLRGMKSLGTVFDAISSEIGVDGILKINRRSFSGHVYNLQTSEHWYIANNIITHNCRCVMLPETKSWEDILGPLGIDTSDIPDTTVQVEDGSDWFDNQSEAKQLEILGSKAALDLYKSGDASLRDFVGWNESDDWGRSIYQKSAKQVAKAS